MVEFWSQWRPSGSGSRMTVCLGTVHQWLCGQMQPLFPPEHTTSALKVAVRHSSDYSVTVVAFHRKRERRERDRNDVPPFVWLTISLPPSVFRSVSHQLFLWDSLSLTFSVSHFMRLLLFTVMLAFPVLLVHCLCHFAFLYLFVCLCPPLLVATLLLTWHKEVVSLGKDEERTKTEAGRNPKCSDWFYQATVKTNHLPLVYC